MARNDSTFQDKRVSHSWRVVLLEASKRVDFRLNSGRRTMAEQWYLYRNRGRPGFAKIVAFPNPNAPHIKVGRQNHSLDVDTGVGDGEQALERELERLGLVIINDVAGEPWHQTEQSEARLIAVAARIAKVPVNATLKKGVVNPDAVTALQRLLRAAGMNRVPLNGKYDLRTRQAVRRYRKKHGMEVNSNVDAHFWKRLRNAVGS
jgi:hypothetical protein